MSYVAGNKTYDFGISASRPDVPPSCSSSSLPRPINSQVQIVSLASSSASQGPNGLISFQIPTGPSTGYLKNNSLYLRFRVAITTGANTAQATAFALQSGSASSLINRLTVSIGGTQVSQITNYHLLHEMLLTHTTSRNYYENDSSIMQCTNTNAFGIGSANGSYIDCVVPIISPLFNGSKSLPLWLLTAPVSVNIDLNSVGNAFYNGASEIVSFTVSNAQLVYEVLQVDAEFMNEVKGAMMQGALYQLNLNDFNTLMTASSASLNYQIGCNYSSVRGVVYSQVKNAPVQNQATDLVKNGQTNCRLYLDGRQVNNFNLDNEAQIFCEMQRCFGILFDSSITSYTTKANYATDGFVAGVSTNRVSDPMAMTGSRAQNINIVLDSAGGNYNTYIVVLYDAVMTIDALGNVLLIK